MRTRSDGQLDAEVRLSRTISPRRLPSNGGICKSSPMCMPVRRFLLLSNEDAD